jgi:hypothetical protein
MSDQYTTRRRFPRIASHHAVLAKRRGGDGLEEFGRTMSLALGGCSFVADEPFGIGSPIELLITVDGDVISAKGNVVYELDVDGGRKEIGVEFAGVDDAGAIERLLTKSE